MTTNQQQPLVICYGSETGNSKAIATRIFKDALEQQIAPDIHLFSLNEYATHYKLRDRVKILKSSSDAAANTTPSGHILDSKSYMVIICSTTGNGDAPQNADSFFRFIKLKTTPPNFFSNVSFSVLGLGDSNYDLFCNAARNIDKRISELGGERILPRGEADEVVGLEVSVEPYIAQIFQQLRKIYSTAKQQPVASEDTAQTPVSLPPTTTPSLPTPLTSSARPIGNSSITSSSSTGNTEPTDETAARRRLSSSSGKLQLEALSSLVSSSPSSASTYLAVERINEEPTQEESLLEYYHSLHSIDNIDKNQAVFYANIHGARYLTTTESSKQVLHLELDITDSPLDDTSGGKFRYEPGDSLGVYCENDHEHVDALLHLLHQRGSIPFGMTDRCPIRIRCSVESKRCIFPMHIAPLTSESSLSAPTCLRTIFTRRVDIMSPVTIPMLQVLSKYTSDQEEKSSILKLTFDTNAYDTQIIKQRANLFDVLTRYPSCRPPLSHLLQELSPITPRFYSISSSPIKHPDEAHIAFSVVKFETPPPLRSTKIGCCTSWLQNKAKKFWSSEEQVRVPVFIKPSPSFRLPKNVNTPIIMVGPGTGVVPFRGFLQHRECMLDKKQDENTNWLFYGCRSIKSDFLYRDDLRDFETSGFVNLTLLVASSREADVGGGIWYGGSYVQDYMRECAANIVEIMIMKKGYLYVCGDAQGMATQVNRVLHQIVEEECGYTPEQAKELVHSWQKEGRYLKEVWS